MSITERPSTASDATANGHAPVPVEALQDLLGGLVREREALRASGAGRAELERNRLAIVGAQWELSRALIARYHPHPEPA
jgi:hypothetical protein